MESKTGEEADYEGQVCHRATDSEAKVGQASATPRRGSAWRWRQPVEPSRRDTRLHLAVYTRKCYPGYGKGRSARF